MNAIELKNLSKRYYLRKHAPMLRERVKRLLRHHSERREEFWALRDLTFCIAKGESVGVIGPNGAGKTTLLKLLSNVTRPTRGELRVNGKVGALIEVGAGFHPELSGRENVFLNGAVLGMSHKEISERFDEIIAFAGIEQFIDMPLKRYSSGMHVRLGFAVAVHMRPDILLVDEVLAVGDYEFQKKCLTFLKNLREEKRTFFLVSHNLLQIQNHCQRVLYINHGRLLFDGEPSEAISRYLEDVHSSGNHQIGLPGIKQQLTGDIDITAIRILDPNGNLIDRVVHMQDMIIELDYIAKNPIRNPKFLISLTREGMELAETNTISDPGGPALVEGTGTVRCLIKQLPVTAGRCGVNILVSTGDTGADIFCWKECTFVVIVMPSNFVSGVGTPRLIRLDGYWTGGDNDGSELPLAVENAETQKSDQ